MRGRGIAAVMAALFLVPVASAQDAAEHDSAPLARRLLALVSADSYFAHHPLERPSPRHVGPPPRLRPVILKWQTTLPGAGEARDGTISGVDAMLFALTMADGASVADLPFAVWGYADASGTVIDKEFRAALPFSEGLAPASDGKWGFVDESGNWIIEPRYSGARPFSEGRAAVETEAGWGFVNKRGTVAIQPQFARVGFFSEGLCSVWPKSQPQVPATGFFRNKQQGGYVDPSGTIVIRPGDHNIYNLHPFADRLAMVRGMEGNDPRYIDRTGKLILRLSDLGLGGVGTFRDGLARVDRSGRQDFIDSAGRPGIEPKFRDALDFSEGSALVTEDGNLWGYTDPTGRWLIEPQFVGVAIRGTRPFHDGLARATARDGWSGFIDTAGRRVFAVEPGQEVGNFDNGLAPFFKHRTRDKELRWGLVDKAGKVVLERRQELPRWMR